MACTLADVLIRRTHIAFETRDNGRGVAKRIAPLVAALLGWSEEQQAVQLDAYDADVTRIFEKAGFSKLNGRRDLGDHRRALTFGLPRL